MSYSHRITAIEVRRFFRAVLKWAASGFRTVEQAEADRRAAICLSCPSNKKVAGCGSCGMLRSAVRNLRGSRTTLMDDQLHACEECGCELKLKIWLPESTGDEQPVNYPPHCWNHDPEKRETQT